MECRKTIACEVVKSYFLKELIKISYICIKLYLNSEFNIIIFILILRLLYIFNIDIIIYKNNTL